MSSLSLLQLKLDQSAAEGTFRQDARGSALVMERSRQTAWLHLPSDTSGPLPLIVVLHGAGKDKFWSLKDAVDGWAERARTHKLLVLYPEAKGSTWDFISSRQTKRGDVDFIECCIDAVRRAYSVDRLAIIGLSDGGSMALCLALHNPGVFQAAISVSAGFCVSPPAGLHDAASLKRTKLFMKHGSDDKMFPLERVGLPLRNNLKRAGYDVEHRVGDGQGHVPQGWQEEFLPAWLAMGPTP